MANVNKNSEILFLFDAKLTNPNGDMDNENKPRMDWETETNLVSDVRLKRYIRDYLETFEGKDLFISSKEEIVKKEKDAKEKAKERLKSKGKTAEDCIDVKYFGAVLAEEGSAKHFTGPVQFNWGFSLNKVELQDSKTIKSSISEEGIGKDFRVKYSFIAFSGSVNAKNADKLNLSEEDLELFDKAMVESIPLARTRSKIGQTPRLYLRVELKDDKSFLKDFREFLDKGQTYNSIEDVKLNLAKLNAYLLDNKDLIEAVYFYKDNNLEIEGMSFDASLFKKVTLTK